MKLQELSIISKLALGAIALATASLLSFVILSSIVFRNDNYIGKRISPHLLDSQIVKHSIRCNEEEGIYILLADSPELSGGLFIGSSTQDLYQFCGREVRVLAVARDQAGIPLAYKHGIGTITTPKEYNEVAVVDILSIKISEQKTIDPPVSENDGSI